MDLDLRCLNSLITDLNDILVPQYQDKHEGIIKRPREIYRQRFMFAGKRCQCCAYIHYFLLSINKKVM